MYIGGIEKGLYLRKLMSMFLYLVLFSCILCCDVNVLIELVITGSMFIEVFGIILIIVKLFIYLVFRFYCLVRLLIRIAKSRGVSLVFCGISFRGVIVGEIVLFIDIF